LKAIDLYSGIGGWSLGLRLAGVEIVGSYEWWGPANVTHGLNFGRTIRPIDIREMPLDELPRPGEVDFVVGSPPCTQFSFANRGGNGDLADGLVDIRRMLEIVALLRPRYWMMENVPRVSHILDRELDVGGSLASYRGLVEVNEVFDMSDFGLPQCRKRMIAGRFPVDRLRSYRGAFRPPTLGEVLNALKEEPVVDPVYRYRLSRADVTDDLPELPFTEEEIRMNRDAKERHPVYNRMAFPDRLDRSARTVTATCTRVSRESTVVFDEALNGYRRLTLRERLCLQGFPITYQLFGESYSDRLRMVGNAIPPFFTYLLGCALREVDPSELRPPSESPYRHVCKTGLARSLAPSQPTARYVSNRSFRASIPGLRFGSGVRFELRNRFTAAGGVEWTIDFYYGSSKKIQRADLSATPLEAALERYSLDRLPGDALEALEPATDEFKGCSAEELQRRWIGASEGYGPHRLVDLIGDSICELVEGMTAANRARCLKCAGELFPSMNPRKSETDLARMVLGAVVAWQWSESWRRSRRPVESGCADEHRAGDASQGDP
jgi:DNA (cytosine-5)-methyltransferase 1